MTTREELKTEAAREEWKKLIAQGWRRTQEVWTKKRGVKLNQNPFLMNCNLIPERGDQVITDMKPTICPHCGAREVRKVVLAFFLFFRKYAYIGSNLF